MKTTRMYGLACGLFVLAGNMACDDLFISERELARRLDLDDDGVENALDCAPLSADVSRFTFWRDLDGDGWGAGEPITGCPDNSDFANPAREGFAASTGDCNDGNNTVFPGAREVCDLADNNCNNEVDEGFVSRWNRDADQDGFGDPADFRDDCGVPNGYVANEVDCDDTLETGASVHPGAVKVCDNGIDDDCDGIVDNTETATLLCRDADNDGTGDPADAFYSCEDQEGYVADCGDCGDGNPNVGPGVAEACEDGVDNDCDGVTDTDAVNTEWYRDADSDGFGDSHAAQSACAPPAGFVGNALDCDDTSDSIKPGVAEVCNNGLDDNCDGSPNECRFNGDITLSDALGVAIEGSAQQEFGFSITACDMNYDGKRDLVVGLPSAHKVVVYPGPIVKPYQANPINEITGPSNSRFGHSISCDESEPQKTHLAVGAPTTNAGASNSGTVFLFIGSPDLTSHSNATAQFNGTLQETRMGITCLFVPDQSGDGKADLFVGAEGYDDSWRGGAFLFSVENPGTFRTSDALSVLAGAGANDLAGSSIATAHLNQDQHLDFIVSAYLNDNTANDAGAVHVFNGPLNGTKSANQADSTVFGVTAFDNAGSSICSGFDFTGDQKTDIVIGAPGHSQNQSTGRIHIVGGNIGESISASTGKTIHSQSVGDRLGLRVSCNVLNNDLIGDILVSAPGVDGLEPNVGAVYLRYGPVEQNFPINNFPSATFIGAEAEGKAGGTLADFVPDVTGDSILDIVILVDTTPTRTLYVIPGISL